MMLPLCFTGFRPCLCCCCASCLYQQGLSSSAAHETEEPAIDYAVAEDRISAHHVTEIEAEGPECGASEVGASLSEVYTEQQEIQYEEGQQQEEGEEYAPAEHDEEHRPDQVSCYISAGRAAQLYGLVLHVHGNLPCSLASVMCCLTLPNCVYHAHRTAVAEMQQRDVKATYHPTSAQYRRALCLLVSR